MKQYRVLCEECNCESYALTEDEGCNIEFCPACGRRGHIEDISEEDNIID